MISQEKSAISLFFLVKDRFCKIYCIALQGFFSMILYQKILDDLTTEKYTFLDKICLTKQLWTQIVAKNESSI